MMCVARWSLRARERIDGRMLSPVPHNGGASTAFGTMQYVMMVSVPHGVSFYVFDNCRKSMLLHKYLQYI